MPIMFSSLLFASLFFLLPSILAMNLPVFRDVTSSIGIRQTPWLKYGGPMMADLNNDGIYDLILTFHKNIQHQVYYGTSQGTFVTVGTKIGGDVHGVSIAPRSTNSSDKIAVFSRGGQAGKIARVPFVLQCDAKGIRDISTQFGFGRPAPRGRSSMFMDLALLPKEKKKQNGGGPDLLWANFLGLDPVLSSTAPRQYAFQNVGGEYSDRQVPGFSEQRLGHGALIDVNGDGIMEVVMYQMFNIYKLVDPFRFEVVTKSVAPGLEVQDFSVTGIAEIDFDNDGDFDMFITRGYQQDPASRKMKPTPQDQGDILLENRGGVFVDVTAKAGVGARRRSQGATPGDFNNDGWIDLMVTVYEGPDVLLMNNGDGTFNTVNAGIPKASGTASDNSLAVDYDEDGRVDIITGQGTASDMSKNGNFLVMRNVMTLTRRNYLHVHVGNEPSGACTALHAVVTVSGKKLRMIRRVGNGGGGQKQGGGSFLDTVHFGCGRVSKVEVQVRWACGGMIRKSGVAVNQKVRIGNFVD